tara:strand:+ start:1612 stop:1815 length:204 start_codon:yes stop_codon:yes gene_type:complete
MRAKQRRKLMDKKFQQITIIISSDDFGGDSTIPPLDILCQMMSESPDLDLISIQDVKDMHLTITEVD